MMVGRPVDQVFPKRDVPIGDVVLKVEDLSNATEFADISLRTAEGRDPGPLRPRGRRAHGGRCRGCSASRRTTRGRVLLDGAPLVIGSPADAIAAGISYVPEDRQDQGAILLARHPREHHACQSLPRTSAASSCRARRSARRRAALGTAACCEGGQLGAEGSANCRAATSRRW